MGIGDDFKNKAEEVGGQAKEKFGEATGDEKLQAEGVGDQASAKVKEGFENAKDAASDAVENIKDAAGKLFGKND